MKRILKNDWHDYLNKEFEKPYYIALREFLKHAYSTRRIYPPAGDIFNALHFTSVKQLKVLILGQDPYHGYGQAHGLAFSVNHGVKIPPSLVNIYKELESDLNMDKPSHGNLTQWSEQGVMLLNTVLTVEAGQANSHRGKGWEVFTDRVIEVINEIDRPIVIMLWGKPAQNKRTQLNNPKHLVLTAPHPSPLSAYRGYFGCQHFSKANHFFMTHGMSPIDWKINS